MSLASQVSNLATRIATEFKTVAPKLVPAGGAAGQVLAKSGAGDYATAWVDRQIVVGTTAPTDTTLIWLDTN